MKVDFSKFHLRPAKIYYKFSADVPGKTIQGKTIGRGHIAVFSLNFFGFVSGGS
jgi:hypothetical protein